MSFKDIIDSFSLSGAIVIILAVFTLSGIIMCAYGNPLGTKIYENSATAFTTFISAKAINKLENK